MNQHYLKKEKFTANWIWRILHACEKSLQWLWNKKFSEYHDLYLKSDTLLLADVFKNFRKLCLKIYHLDPVKFLPVPGLAWQEVWKKKIEVKLELLTDTDMLLVVEKGIRGGIHRGIQRKS